MELTSAEIWVARLGTAIPDLPTDIKLLAAELLALPAGRMRATALAGVATAVAALAGARHVQAEDRTRFALYGLAKRLEAAATARHANPLARAA